ncbi:hypothetical protein BX616_009752 [Lobosporangium transversale]|nr:hypothetical protein BX616_009752 [Lobosporangium transversale]
MHLDDAAHDDLKAHLTKELTLISDADPSMLADYIIALLKHDKNNAELQALCISQLEDFLTNETERFVTSLFQVLESKSYIRGTTALAEATSPSKGTTATSSALPGGAAIYDDEYIPTGPAADRDNYEIPSSRGPEKHHRGDSDVSDDEDRSFKHARRDDGRDSDRRRREYSPSRPSDDDRYSTRRGRSSDGGNPNGHSDYDRRGGDRSIRQHGLTTAGFNSRNNFNGMNNNNNQPGFNHNAERQQWNGQQYNRGNFDNGPRGNFDNGPRGTFQEQNQGPWRGGDNMRGGRGSAQGGPGFGQERRRQRCRDYDEKGYCMRGDMCPYDHGEDRIVVGDMPGGPFNILGMAPGIGPNNQMSVGGGHPPFFPDPLHNAPIPNPSDAYNPEVSSLSTDDLGLLRPALEPPQQGTQEGARYNQEASGRGNIRGRGSLRGMRGRGRSSGSHPYSTPGRFNGASNTATTKTSLVVEHIPDEFNTIDKVNEFFKRFGNLTNIQVDQPMHKALIQYSTREEASAAYNSPDVIFGNRFVKVYWQPDDLDSATFGRQPKPAGQVRPETNASASHTSHHGQHAASKAPPTSVLMTPERAAELAAERAAKAAKADENKKAMMEIQRQREALIQRQQEEQKVLLAKIIANKNMSEEDKNEILKGLKNVAIEVTKEPAAALGLENQGGYASRGRGGFLPRGRGRGAPSNTWTRGGSHNRTFRIDNRSTKLSVSNIEEASKEGLKEHFEAFGEIESFTLGADGTSATVQYKTRVEAEKAMQHGSQVPNATSPLKLGWISEPQTTPVATSTSTFKSPGFGTTSGANITPAATAPGGAVTTAAEAGYESEDDQDERSWKR